MSEYTLDPAQALFACAACGGEAPGPDVAFETVARSLDSFSIEILRARLQAEGIAAFTVDQGINQANSLYSIAVGGIRLMVPKEDAEEARQIIALLRSGAFELSDEDRPD